MTQEDKELLLKDISARLPYNVKVKVFWGDNQIDDCIFDFSVGMAILDDFEEGFVNNIKPYLRPLSSMTDEEKEEYDKFFTTITAKEANFGKWISPADDVALIDWYNKHHFDYRGLIPMGLALEAEEGMYKTE